MKAAVFYRLSFGPLQATVMDFETHVTKSIGIDMFEKDEYIEVTFPKPKVSMHAALVTASKITGVVIYDKDGQRIPLYCFGIDDETENLFLSKKFAELGYGYGFDNGPITYFNQANPCVCGSNTLGHPGHAYYCPLDTRVNKG